MAQKIPAILSLWSLIFPDRRKMVGENAKWLCYVGKNLIEHGGIRKHRRCTQFIEGNRAIYGSQWLLVDFYVRRSHESSRKAGYLFCLYTYVFSRGKVAGCNSASVSYRGR